MTSLLQLLNTHGYVVMALVVLAEALGLPVPAAIALIYGGAAAAAGHLSLPLVLIWALAAMTCGDLCLYFLGRYTGWGLLAFLCKVSASPETCILRSAESFYKKGKITLVIAKFVPGLNTMAPPLAGSMKMRLGQFLRFDVMGALLYTSAYILAGFLFHGLVASFTSGILAAQHAVGLVIVAGVLAYIAYRAWLYRKWSIYRVVPRIKVQELAERLATDSDHVLVADVRSHGYYDAGAERIQGSMRLEPNNLPEEVKKLPRDKDIFVYCT